MSNKLIKGPQQNSNDILVNDGSKVYNIKNQRREIIGQFVFTPSDMGIIERYEHTAGVIEAIQERLKEHENDTDVLKIKKEVESEIKEEIDYLFASDVSGSFFKAISPITPLESGEFYVENIVNAVRKVIEMETGKRLGKAKSRASKYTQKYHK